MVQGLCAAWRAVVLVWCRLVVWMVCWGVAGCMVVRWRCLRWGVRGAGCGFSSRWCESVVGVVLVSSSWRPAACWSWCDAKQPATAASAGRQGGQAWSVTPVIPNSSRRTVLRNTGMMAAGVPFTRATPAGIVVVWLGPFDS